MKILVTGGTGMLGKAIARANNGENQIILVGSKDYDLRYKDEAYEMFLRTNPDVVIHGAARVGGVKANTEYIGDFFYENICINTNVLDAARKFSDAKVISILSSCIYPDDKNESLYEEDLHKGAPHPSNFGYAYAKRMLEVQSRAYNEQDCDNRFKCVIPTNMYGWDDNFDLENGHVIPSIIRKIYEAKISGRPPEFWGTGKPLRQFAYVDDVAGVILEIAKHDDALALMNVGFHEEHSIKFAVDEVSRYFDYVGPIKWNSNKPEGQYRKTTHCWNMYEFLKKHNIDKKHTTFQEGLHKTCSWFLKHYPNVRGINA